MPRRGEEHVNPLIAPARVFECFFECFLESIRYTAGIIHIIIDKLIEGTREIRQSQYEEYTYTLGFFLLTDMGFMDSG